MKLNSKNYVIGITGGVGSGKSTALYILENECGAQVYQADRISFEVSRQGQSAFEDVVELFGEEILMVDGNPDRERIAEIVFGDEELRNKLNAIIHPKVYEYLRNKALRCEGFVVLEAALPVEGHFPEICDEVWFIKSSKNSRVERVMDSREYSREKAEHINATQLSDEEFEAVSTKVISNDGSVEELSKALKAAAMEAKAAFEGAQEAGA